MATKNPRFCGVELALVDMNDESSLYEANVHGCRVQLYGKGTDWYSEVRLPGVEQLQNPVAGSSPASSLRSLRGIIQNVHRATERMLDPSKRKPKSR